MSHNIYIYIAIMAIVTIAIRILPLTIFKKHIKNTFIKSFLYYVPYVTLAIMIFPAITDATQTPIAGFAALGVGLVISWFDGNLFRVSLACCAVVFIIELII